VATLIGSLYVLATIALAPFLGYLGLVAIAAILGRRTRRASENTSPTSPTPALAIVVPAHNEEEGISATVVSCLAADYPADRRVVFVIADNCDDATTVKAREAGAVVIERRDPDRKSKGHAMEFFFEHAENAWRDGQYDAALIIDADTRIDAGLLRACANSNIGTAWRLSSVKRLWLIRASKL
jgi:cellulose synthase/poly-beta-1,6-N-acetylglucosamine synthase-like glycosyltransferase